LPLEAYLRRNRLFATSSSRLSIVTDLMESPYLVN
jgi:hypothetical protein